MSDKQVDDWFESLTPDQQPILSMLRRLIKTSFKTAVEQLKWSRPCYSNQRVLFCYLHSTKHHVVLGFHKGTSLDDPENLLEGTGKDMRHIKFRIAEDVNKTAIKLLLKQAWLLS